MGVMLAFLAGAAAAGTAALLAPAMKLEVVRRAAVDLLATAFRATDVVNEAIAPVRKELTMLVEEGKAKARAPTAKPVSTPTVKVV
jgi:hypothetical protein